MFRVHCKIARQGFHPELETSAFVPQSRGYGVTGSAFVPRPRNYWVTGAAGKEEVRTLWGGRISSPHVSFTIRKSGECRKRFQSSRAGLGFSGRI
jgi:hypothetical protein